MRPFYFGGQKNDKETLIFTGIVQAMGVVISCDQVAGVVNLVVDVGHLSSGVETGASIAINGVCLTVVSVENGIVEFQMVSETTSLSNLGRLSAGSQVNVERSYRVGDEVGGHVLSGHVACTAEVVKVVRTIGHQLIYMAVAEQWMAYLFDKGFVALNGTSLTIAEIDREKRTIAVSLIPETLERTIFRSVAVGDAINLEIDSRTQAVVETVREVLADKAFITSLSK